jgi:hypothetical protein
MIIQRSLLACLALCAGFLLRGDRAAASYQTDATIRSTAPHSVDAMVGRVAQDDNSGSTQTPEPTATPDVGNGDDSNQSPPSENQQ